MAIHRTRATLLTIGGMGYDHQNDPGEGEQDTADRQQGRAGAMDGHRENQSPDRCGGIDHGGDITWHDALAPGEEGEGNHVVEERDQQKPGQEASRRQLLATEAKHAPEQRRAETTPEERHPEGRKDVARDADHQEGDAPHT